jgi:hypothetical protein
MPEHLYARREDNDEFEDEACDFAAHVRLQWDVSLFFSETLQ